MKAHTKAFYTRHARTHADKNTLDSLPDQFHRLLHRFENRVPSGRVLDLGCGDGRDTHYLATENRSVTGLDLAPGMIREATTKYPSCPFILADAARLPFYSDTFDGVWSPATLFFLPPDELRESLHEIRRVGTNSCVCHLGFKVAWDTAKVTVEKWGGEIDQWEYSLADIQTILADAGFEITHLETASPTPETKFANVFCTPSPIQE